MKKFDMTIQFTVEALNRHKAWIVTQGIIQKHLRGLASVLSEHELSDKETEDSVAVNEPIKTQR